MDSAHYLDEAFRALRAWSDWTWDPVSRFATRGNALLRFVCHDDCVVGILFTGSSRRVIIAQGDSERDVLRTICMSSVLRPDDISSLHIPHLADVARNAARRYVVSRMATR